MIRNDKRCISRGFCVALFLKNPKISSFIAVRSESYLMLLTVLAREITLAPAGGAARA